jgi:hypothetical protein
MSKSLLITSKSCSLEVSKKANTIKINGVSLEEVIVTNLPKDLSPYKEYSAEIEISISFPDEDELLISTVGYNDEEVKDEQYQGSDN